jgi:CHAD domain-containing protein
MSNPRQPRWTARATAAANARRELPRLVAAYFARVRELLAAGPPPRKLHAIRLETKRLRYTLELFRPCYGPAFDTRIAALRHLQQLLGEVNDCSATGQWVSHSMRPSPQRVRIAKFLTERAAAQAQVFHTAWTDVFDAPGQELWWTRYLSRNARTPSR